MGPVAPLVAVYQAIKQRQTAEAQNFAPLQVLFIGTATGPEKDFLSQYPEIKFKTVPAGKIRRYFSLLNLFTPFFVIAGFIKSFFILLFFKPEAVVSAGGFVAVPVIFASKLLGAKILIHQLDLEPTLSNVLVKKLANIVSVTFAKSLEDFKEQKPVLIGSLIREEARLCQGSGGQARIKDNKIVLFLGGGTGAQALNELAIKTAPLLENTQVWQITGKNKNFKNQSLPANFHCFEFLAEDYYEKLAQADLVISRGGLSTLMELSDLLKPTVIVPIPNSQQEQNARYFTDRKAAVYLEQNGLTPDALAGKIKSLLNSPQELEELAENIEKIMNHGGERKIADLILSLI